MYCVVWQVDAPTLTTDAYASFHQECSAIGQLFLLNFTPITH